MIPRLETPRLILREYRASDFPTHDAMWAHPRTTRDFEGYTYSQEDIWMRFQRNWGQWAVAGHGLWALEHKPSGCHAGVVGFLTAKRDIDVPYRDAPEAAWMVAPDLHGQGLAGEAVTAALAWADANIDAPESWCMINASNTISQKVAARAGYRPAETADYKGHPMLTFLRPRGGA